ncbi:unnamed protein product [Hydatigera taeniaeformis]|uniref:ZNF711 n=1 Tax=Hydatigena taeniaeformis TaxID=6205 RepID=A0A0R3WXH0_HYDTA|nr:unnamed protein product [Hydatigera taeniaeformis]
MEAAVEEGDGAANVLMEISEEDLVPVDGKPEGETEVTESSHDARGREMAQIS